MPDQDYQHVQGKGKFLYLGIDLKHPPDLMPQGKCPYMLNLSPNQVQGGVTARAGLVKVGDTGSGFPIHSVARVNNAIPGAPIAWTRFAGSGGSVYQGQGNLAVADTGYSGNPLSMVPYRPPLSPETWLYVYDSLRQSKFRVDGTRQNLGVVPPLKPPATDLNQPNLRPVLDATATTGWVASGSAAAPTLVERVTPATVAAAIVWDTGTTGWANITPMPQSGSGNPFTGWGIGMRVTIASEQTTVFDVFPQLPSTTVAAVVRDDMQIATIVPATPPPGVRRDACVLVNGYAHRVLSVTEGPENSFSFRVLDTKVPGGITAGMTVGFPASFRCYLTAAHTPGSEVISSKALQSVMSLGTGISGSGLVANSVLGPVNCLSVGGRPITDEDYVHVSLRLDNPANVLEVHFLLDVDTATNDFQHNYYYYVLRQNDFQSVAGGTQTAVAGMLDALTTQIAETYPVQKDQIQFAQTPYPAYQQAEFGIPVSEQIGAGLGQWYEAIFKIRDLTRVGDDESTNLNNVKGAAVLVLLAGSATVTFGGWWVGGTYGPDSNYNSYGNQGQPILYRYRYRSSLTGAFSEVSPATRNGIPAMRSGVLVSVAASTDPQVDLIDIERNGGTFDTWHRCLVVPNVTAQILDDVRETVAMAGDPLELLHYQPWPVTDQPRSGTCNVIGNRIHRLTGDLFNMSWTRGVEVIVNQQTYTLYSSPYTTSDLELAENVGNYPNVKFTIPEATIAGYALPYACQGPDGRIFATGDPFNPGNLYFSQPYEPDSASDQGYIEVTGPSEPLGPPVYYEGAVYVFSNLSGYRVEATPGQPNPYAAYKLGTVSGQLMPYAISAEGPAIFYRGPDGVYLFASGGSMNITRDDLFPLLPFESRPGLPVSVAGQVLYPPNDTKPQRQRMSFADGLLFYDFMDIQNQWGTLTFAVDTKGWCPYSYLPGIACHYQEQGVGDPLTLAGGADGVLYALDPAENDNGRVFECVIVTPADDQGDSRATKEYGDLMMDIGVRHPASYSFTVTVTDSVGVQSSVDCSIADTTGTV